MTQPVAHGHHDWGRYVSQADIVYFNQSVPDIDVDTDYGPFFVGNVPCVKLTFTNDVNTHRVELIFYTSNALTVEVGRYPFDVYIGSDVNQSVPVLSSWLVMRVVVAAANSAFTAQLTSAPLRGRVPSPFSDTGIIIAVSGVIVPAGGTLIAVGGPIYPGEAFWSARTTAASFVASLESVNFIGAIRSMDEFTQVALERRRVVALPATQMQIRFVNTSGGAATTSVFLNAKSSLLDG